MSSAVIWPASSSAEASGEEERTETEEEEVKGVGVERRGAPPPTATNDDGDRERTAIDRRASLRCAYTAVLARRDAASLAEVAALPAEARTAVKERICEGRIEEKERRLA